MSYSIESISESIGARRLGNTPATIDWLLTDSRSLNFPEETLFFALATKRNDGARYIADLYARGVRNFVLTEQQQQTVPATLWSGVNFLLVNNPLKALQKLAEQHRDRFQIPVIGITGSNGKTVVKEWLHQLLSPDRTVIRSPRSYNSQIGVPLSVWQMNEQADLAIFEAGISEPGEMRALQGIIKPTIGILTNIGGAHQENFFSLQEKCMEPIAADSCAPSFSCMISSYRATLRSRHIRVSISTSHPTLATCNRAISSFSDGRLHPNGRSGWCMWACTSVTNDSSTRKAMYTSAALIRKTRCMMSTIWDGCSLLHGCCLISTGCRNSTPRLPILITARRDWADDK